MFSIFRFGKSSKKIRRESDKAQKPKASSVTLLPGSHGEHELQSKFGTKERALKFYDKQVLDHLSPVMQEFIADQEVIFIATSDKEGECDCSPRFGQPGFVRVLDEKYLIYPELRGNGVMASMGNIRENPHIGIVFVDFFETTVGLHVNGHARICEHETLMGYKEKLSQDVLDDMGQEGSLRPERWVMVEVEEAYIHCSKHIPLLKKEDKKIEWGTDNAITKRSDFFQLDDVSLYKRIGGDAAMQVVVDRFYLKVLRDESISYFFEDIDMPAQMEKQKNFLKMAFGGCPVDQYTGKELRTVHQPLVDKGLNDKHFNQVLKHLKTTLKELDVPENEIESMMGILESTRNDILCR